MANSVLDVSRLETGRLPLEVTDHDLSEMIRKVVKGMQPLYPDREVTIDAPPSTRIQCDGKLVYRVLENLVSNGLKHTPPARGLRVCVASESTGVRVTVQDEGPGVPPELREKIFEKFGMLKTAEARRYQSVGLGLAMCRLTIMAHGGAIGVESAPVRGSSFWFTLPHVAKAA
jgi:signal transduction histidine kinase